jgi:hypothetical protein
MICSVPTRRCWHARRCWRALTAVSSCLHAAIAMRTRTAATAWLTSASVMLSSGSNSSATAATKSSRHSDRSPFAPCCTSATCSRDKAHGRSLVITVVTDHPLGRFRPGAPARGMADRRRREAAWCAKKETPAKGRMTGASWGGVGWVPWCFSAPAGTSDRDRLHPRFMVVRHRTFMRMSSPTGAAPSAG